MALPDGYSGGYSYDSNGNYFDNSGGGLSANDGLGINWGGSGGGGGYGQALFGGGGNFGVPHLPSPGAFGQSSWIPSTNVHGAGAYADAIAGMAHDYSDRRYSDQLFQQQMLERNMALQAKYDRQNMYAQLMADLLGRGGAYANMPTNTQVQQGQGFLAPSAENARQGTINGGITDDEFNTGVSDARQRVASQGQAMQGAINSALAQRGVASPLAGMIAGMRSQFEGGRAAGQATSDMNRARQSGRISYSGLYNDATRGQADLATRPTMENSMAGIRELLGYIPGAKKQGTLTPGGTSVPLPQKYNPKAF